MSITVTGKVERRDIGMGAWALVSDEGTTTVTSYQLPVDSGNW